MDANQDVPQRSQKLIIGLCTHNRPKELAECLASIALLHIPEGFELHCVVVENGPTAENAHVTKAANLPFRITHKLESRMGVVHARNRLFDIAEHENADWLAMVDDDETVDENWLTEFVSAMNSFPDVRFFCGPYVILPSNSLSAWRRPPGTDKRPLGSPTPFAKTGNFLIHKRLFDTSLGGFRFDTVFNHSGGEDYDISRRIIASGEKLIFVPTAKVYEPMADERSGFWYGLNRVWRDQHVVQKHLYLRLSFSQAISKDIAELLQIIVQIAFKPVYLTRNIMFGRLNSARYTLWDFFTLIARMWAIIGYPLSGDIKAYGKPSKNS